MELPDPTGAVPRPEPPAAPQTAVCAVHEGAQSTGTCARCGNFVCPLCLDPESALPDRCEACREREGAEAVPWERGEGSWFRRWWSTCAAFVVRPGATLERVQPGSWPASMGFTAVTGGVIGGAFTVVGACVLGAVFALGFGPSALGAGGSPAFSGSESGLLVAIMGGVLILYPAMMAIGTLLSQAVRALVYHLGVALVGGEGGFGASFWPTGYLLSIQLVLVPLMFFQYIPIIGPLISLTVMLGMEVWLAVQLTRVARRFHGLVGHRAIFAGWFPFVVAVTLFTSCCFLGFAMIFAERM